MTAATSPSARYKESGNKFFAMKNYSTAAACYRRGLEELPSNNVAAMATVAGQDGTSAKAKASAMALATSRSDDNVKMEVVLRGNLALALLKMTTDGKSTSSEANFSDCIEECSLALKLDTNNAKILYRRGQARQRLANEWNQTNEWSQAENDFTQCIQILEGQMRQRKQQQISGKASKLPRENKATMMQINDAKKSLEKLRAAKNNLNSKPEASLSSSSWSSSSLSPVMAPQPSDSEFPWDVPALLRNAPPPEPLPMGGSIVRSALTPPQQKLLYEMLRDNVNASSEEYRMLRMTDTASSHGRLNPDNRPQPFVTWVHPYTRLSNVRERPTRLLRWAEGVMHALAPESGDHEVDSMLAQLYALGGSLLEHRDEDLSWGIGVSLGSYAYFDCLPDEGSGEERKRVAIRSGDIIVGEFGKMPHAVTIPEMDNDPPLWWKDVDHFGSKMRCNVLFRKALTAKRQRKLAEERARKLYGISLKDLKERTGKEESYLSVHLRHLALE